MAADARGDPGPAREGDGSHNLGAEGRPNGPPTEQARAAPRALAEVERMKPKRDKAGPVVAAERPPRLGEVSPPPAPKKKRTRVVQRLAVPPLSFPPVARATPLQVLQDRRFGAWLRDLDPRDQEIGIVYLLDIAGRWPLYGSLLDAFDALGDAPVEVSMEDVAALFEMARRFAMHLHGGAPSDTIAGC
jgi:hypothetical protein